MKYSEVLNRLHNLINYTPSQSELCRILDTKQSTMSNRAMRDSEIPVEDIGKINKYYSINLFTNASLTQPNIDITPDNNSVSADYYPDIFGSCGGGAFVLSENKVQVQIPKTLFFKNISSIRKYSVINAIGESMLPLIQDKDKLIVEHFESGDQIQDNRIYVFSYLDSIFVKRLVKNINELIIISDNPDKNIYKNICLQKDDMNNIYIIGQIVGLMRDLR